MEHDRRFHLARMADAAEFGFADFSQSFRSDCPIGGEDESRCGHGGFQFAKRGPQWRVVPAVAVEDEDFFRAHAGERLAELRDQLNVNGLRHIERAGEVHVVR